MVNLQVSQLLIVTRYTFKDRHGTFVHGDGLLQLEFMRDLNRSLPHCVQVGQAWFVVLTRGVQIEMLHTNVRHNT